MQSGRAHGRRAHLPAGSRRRYARTAPYRAALRQAFRAHRAADSPRPPPPTAMRRCPLATRLACRRTCPSPCGNRRQGGKPRPSRTRPQRTQPQATQAPRETASGALTARPAACQLEAGPRASRARVYRQPSQWVRRRTARRRIAHGHRRAQCGSPVPPDARAPQATSGARMRADKVAETRVATPHVPRVQPTTRSPLQPVASDRPAARRRRTTTTGCRQSSFPVSLPFDAVFHFLVLSRAELTPNGLPRARQTAHDGAYRYSEYLGRLLITKPFDNYQQHNGALRIRQSLDRANDLPVERVGFRIRRGRIGDSFQVAVVPFRTRTAAHAARAQLVDPRGVYDRIHPAQRRCIRL